MKIKTIFKPFMKKIIHYLEKNDMKSSPYNCYGYRCKYNKQKTKYPSLVLLGFDNSPYEDAPYFQIIIYFCNPISGTFHEEQLSESIKEGFNYLFKKYNFEETENLNPEFLANKIHEAIQAYINSINDHILVGILTKPERDHQK